MKSIFSKNLLLVFLTTSPLAANIQTFEIRVHEAKRQLELSGECSLIQTKAQKFANALTKDTVSPKLPLYHSFKKHCLIDLTPHLSSFFYKVPWNGGDESNCWGVVTNFSKIIPEPRYMHWNEFEYWLTSPLCKNISTPQPGDLGVIYLPGTRHTQLHSFIYLDNDFRFSKHGPEGRLVFENKKEIDYSHSFTNTSYYRCKSMQSFILDGTPIHKELLKLKKELDSMVADYMNFSREIHFRKSVRKYYNLNIHEQINNFDNRLFYLKLFQKRDLYVRQMLRVRTSEIRRNIINIQYTKLLKISDIIQLDNRIQTNQIERQSLLQSLQKILTKTFMEKHFLNQRIHISIRDHSNKKLHLDLLMDNSGMPASAQRRIQQAWKQLPSHIQIHHLIPVPLSHWKNKIKWLYQHRNDDLKSKRNPYTTENT